MGTQGTGLEFDARNAGLYSVYDGDNSPEAIHRDTALTNKNLELPSTPLRSSGKNFLKIRTATFLGLVIALTLITAITAAAVAGSLVEQKSRALEHLRKAGCQPVPNTTDTDSTPSPSSPSSSSAPNPPGDLNATTDCQQLGATYAATYKQVQFNIYCNTGYHTPATDILSVYVYTFEDCINACVSYNDKISAHRNSSCYAVTYVNGVAHYTSNLPPNDYGNCWLKDQPYIDRLNISGSSSACLT